MLLSPKTTFVGHSHVHLAEIHSTNDYAVELISKNKPIEGTVISADFQRTGKGQFGRTWQSERSSNLLFSVVLYPEFLSAQQAHLLNFTYALAVSKAIDQFLPSASTLVKWPNDIYYEEKKIAGLLVQNAISGHRLQYSVLGVGINVNQLAFPPELPNPVSLRMICNATISRSELLAALCSCLEDRYVALRTKSGRTLVCSDYASRLYRKHRLSMFASRDNAEFSGEIIGVREDGSISIKTNSSILNFRPNEVKLLHQ